MTSKTTTYVVRIDNAEGFDARATDTKAYTHAVVVGPKGNEGAISWHSSAELAQRAADGWKTHDHPDAHIVEAFARNGSKVTVTKALRAELAAAAEAPAEEAPVEEAPGSKMGKRRTRPATVPHAKKAEPKKAKEKAEPTAPVRVKGKVKKADSITEMAGYRVHTKSRSSKTTAVLVDGTEQGLDVSAGKWQTICLDHSFIVAHSGQRVARDVLGHPETWCEPCREAFEAKA